MSEDELAADREASGKPVAAEVTLYLSQLAASVVEADVAPLSVKGKLPPDVLRQLGGRVPLITFVTLAELTRWVEQRQWGAHRRELLARWLVGKHVLHSDDDVARTWGAITRTPTSGVGPDRRMTRG